jgi:hypothetical protein
MTLATVQQRMKRTDIAALVRKGLDNLGVIAPSVKVVFKKITVESNRDSDQSPAAQHTDAGWLGAQAQQAFAQNSRQSLSTTALPASQGRLLAP